MKLFFLVIIGSIFAVCSAILTCNAQNKVTETRVVAAKPTPQTKKNTSDISKVDFKNYTFPDFDGNFSKTFSLKSGKSEKEVFPKYRLRKTYYFDLTGDENDEAISHIIAEGCQMGCETSNLFYIYTAENRQPKLLWKIATGGDIMGGLKSATFNINEIIMEVFGNCSVENQIIKAEVDLKNNAKLKTTSYTRLVFSANPTGFTQTDRDILPLTKDIDFSGFRAQIKFGK